VRCISSPLATFVITALQVFIANCVIVLCLCHINKTLNQLNNPGQRLTVCPHIALGGEARVVEHLGRRPLDGELGAAGAGVLIIQNVSGQAKVSHFDHILGAHETITGGQISMNVVVALQVGHALADLYAHVQQQTHVANQGLLMPAQVVQQGAMLHVLGHNVDGSMLGADAI